MITLSDDDIGGLFLFTPMYHGTILFPYLQRGNEGTHTSRFGPSLAEYYPPFSCNVVLIEYVYMFDFQHGKTGEFFARLLVPDGLVGWIHCNPKSKISAKLVPLTRTEE